MVKEHTSHDHRELGDDEIEQYKENGKSLMTSHLIYLCAGLIETAQDCPN
jgi:hypothetical protein